MKDSDQHNPNEATAGDGRALERARKAYEQRAWRDAYEAFTSADRAAPVGIEDLERMVWSSALVGQDEEHLKTLERLHQAHLDAGDCLRAARWAAWLGIRLLILGESARASGWLGRAQRLVDRENRDCVEKGYLLIPVIRRSLAAGDAETAHATAARAVEIGDRFGEADLVAMARHLQGRALIQQGRLREGLELLDEAMVAATAGELSPVITGLIYCSVIDGCQGAYAFDRAREWTTALSDWCRTQPQLVTFTGSCLVHRAEILELNGAWADALEEAQRAATGKDPTSVSAAAYRQAEIHRLRGEFALAEEAYRTASEFGREPQPGLALLRLAQGRNDAAAGAIRRVVDATSHRLQRTKLLPAYVDIMLAVGDIDEARRASLELEDTATTYDSEGLAAMAAHARGAVQLAEGDARGALTSLRHAFALWHKMEAPYVAARVRVLAGRACRIVGDEDGAELELGAAKAVFERLGAATDIQSIEAGEKASPATPSHGLTARELQVLRLVAAGKTNKVIANELSLSEKTVDRHVSNIFTKLDVTSRAAATAYAYEQKLV